jgi:hypothetical protein
MNRHRADSAKKNTHSMFFDLPQRAGEDAFAYALKSWYMLVSVLPKKHKQTYSCGDI